MIKLIQQMELIQKLEFLKSDITAIIAVLLSTVRALLLELGYCLG